MRDERIQAPHHGPRERERESRSRITALMERERRIQARMTALAEEECPSPHHGPEGERERVS